MTDDQSHEDCMRMRRIGIVSAEPDAIVTVEHVSCMRHPEQVGAISLETIWHVEAGPDEPPQYERGTIMLTIGEALGLANRLQRAVNATLSVHEPPADPALELSRLTVSDSREAGN